MMDAGDYIPPESPRWAPTALPISSKRPKHRPHPSFSEPAVNSPENMNEAAAMTQNPYQFDEEDPLQIICEHFNVVMPTPLRAVDLRRTYDLPFSRDTNLPTHLLAVFDLPFNVPDTPITLIPVRIDTLAQNLGSEIFSRIPPLSAYTSVNSIRLPTVPIHVPHASSVSLLLLYALGIRRDPNSLAAQLLPLAAIEEFPSAAAMAQVMASCCDGDRLGRYLTYNQGVWKNVLALGPKDTDVVCVVQTVWNVTAESRRIWQHERDRSRRGRRERSRGR